MRLVYRLVLATLLWALTLALGCGTAFAIFQCGMFDGSFSCRATSGGPMHGKNAGPIGSETRDETPPADTAAAPPGTALPPAPGTSAPNPAQGGQSASVEYGAKPGEHACPPGYTVLAVPDKYGYCQPPARGTAEAATSACQHGMVGAPPSCHCPKNSELLGGNCVHYTATMCQNELPVNVNPEPCQDLEAKLSCKMRQDGLKDCCCLTYDKL
jgi:hypothetical protein